MNHRGHRVERVHRVIKTSVHSVFSVSKNAQYFVGFTEIIQITEENQGLLSRTRVRRYSSTEKPLQTPPRQDGEGSQSLLQRLPRPDGGTEGVYRAATSVPGTLTGVLPVASARPSKTSVAASAAQARKLNAQT